jgi:hypothetical protein
MVRPLIDEGGPSFLHDGLVAGTMAHMDESALPRERRQVFVHCLRGFAFHADVGSGASNRNHPASSLLGSPAS